LLPPRGGPNFRFSVDGDTERTEQHALSADLSNMVKGRAAAREIISWIEESVFPLHGLEGTLKVVTQTFLDIGSKSFTHLITVLERYGQVITKICPDQDKQVMLIAEVGYYWKNNAQVAAIAIDRMMGYRLISNLAIVRWVFSPENIEQFHTSDHPWEVYHLNFYRLFCSLLLDGVCMFTEYNQHPSPPTQKKKKKQEKYFWLFGFPSCTALEYYK
jgi:nuclear cap-binding protein subunit 1